MSAAFARSAARAEPDVNEPGHFDNEDFDGAGVAAVANQWANLHAGLLAPLPEQEQQQQQQQQQSASRSCSDANQLEDEEEESKSSSSKKDEK